jgi:hypothetical protein
MGTPFLTLTLAAPDDLVRVRQLARQAAKLLSLEAADRTLVAAAAFDLAWQALQPTGRACVAFSVAEGKFRIVCTAGGVRCPGDGRPLQLERALPAAPESALDRELTWMLEEVLALAPEDALEELRTANRELLGALLELAPLRRQAAGTPAAAKPEPDAA